MGAMFVFEGVVEQWGFELLPTSKMENCQWIGAGHKTRWSLMDDVGSRQKRQERLVSTFQEVAGTEVCAKHHLRINQFVRIVASPLTSLQ